MAHALGHINLSNNKQKVLYGGPNGGLHTKGLNGNKTSVTKKVANSMRMGVSRLKNYIKTVF